MLEGVGFNVGFVLFVKLSIRTVFSHNDQMLGGIYAVGPSRFQAENGTEAFIEYIILLMRALKFLG